MKRNLILTLISLMLVLSLGLFAACGEDKEPAANNDPAEDLGKTEDPGTTDEPETSTDPETPTDPGTTDEPSKPDDVETPDEPSVDPDQPETPSEPEKPAHTHVWGMPTVTKAATCKEAGVQTRSCDCGELKTEIINKLTEHNYDNGVVSGTTKTYTCTVCGKTRVEEVQAGHTHEWGNPVETKAPTCGDEGEVTFSCACGEKITSSIKPTDKHNWETTIAGGNVVTKCTICKQEIDPFATPSDAQ